MNGVLRVIRGKRVKTIRRKFRRMRAKRGSEKTGLSKKNNAKYFRSDSVYLGHYRIRSYMTLQNTDMTLTMRFIQKRWFNVFAPSQCTYY